jgi:two-component system response regulator CpxR
VEKDEPEIMVLDLRMPGMQGLEVLRRIKRDHPDVQVIILTGHGSAADQDLAEELGAFAYLQKPVNLNRLLDAMKAAYLKLKGRPWSVEGG